MMERERAATLFFNSTNMLDAPKMMHAANGCIILSYEGELEDMPVTEALEEISGFHSRSISYGDFPANFQSSVFQNNRRERGKARLRKHYDLVKTLWPDIGELEKAMDCTPPEAYARIPKILVHGDLHRGNIQRRPDRSIIFIDFERAYFDFFTWDMSRAILDLETSEVDAFIAQYLERLKELPLGEAEIKRLILGDCLYRIVTDSIADRQTVHFASIAERHLQRDSKFLREVVLPSLL